MGGGRFSQIGPNENKVGGLNAGQNRLTSPPFGSIARCNQLTRRINLCLNN